jgi:serine/threonine protein kinase
VGRFAENDIILKNYRIEKSIGQGAFGEVYLATHLGLNGLRAIKVLHRHETGVGSTEYEEYRDRFRQESQLMEWFRHPNLVTVYDFQEEDNILYLVMEYAAGGSLQNRLDIARRENTPFPVNEVVQIGIDTTEGLAALHAKDVIHRDLKPSNILFGSDGHARVADLGLAQIPGGSSLRSQLSIPKPHPGTPAYMSPEQEVSGSYLRPSSDVYSLGLVMFELLTGRNFRNLRPDTRLKSLRPSSPDWLDDLLAQMLSKDPDGRPWDSAEVVHAIRNGLQQDVKAPTPLPPQQKSDRKTGKVTLGIVLAVFLASILLIASIFFLSPKTPIPTSVANTVASPIVSSGRAESPTDVISNSPSPLPSPSSTPVNTETPSGPNWNDILGSSTEAQSAWNNHLKELEDVALEKYSDADRSVPGRKLIYTINLQSHEPLLFTNRWCAINGQILASNKNHIAFSNLLSNTELPESKFGYATYQTDSTGGWTCYAQFVLIKIWPSGKYIFTTRKNIDSVINDGQTSYSAGALEREYRVTVN